MTLSEIFLPLVRGLTPRKSLRLLLREGGKNLLPKNWQAICSISRQPRQQNERELMFQGESEMNRELQDAGVYQDLNDYETVARIMAMELSSFELRSDPLDVAETIEELTEEMEDMPGVISDCRQAAEAFLELESALDRMYSLADRASEAGADNPALLEALDREFGGYSEIVARLAGADDFEGPILSLASVEEAKVTRIILGCLSEARRTFAMRLEEQRRHINSAMDDAMNLLLRILEDGEEISYDTKEGLTALLNRLRTLDPSVPAPAAARPYTLH